MTTTAIVGMTSVFDISGRIRRCLEDQTGRVFDPNLFTLGGMHFAELGGGTRKVSDRHFTKAIETAFARDGSLIELLPGARDGLAILAKNYSEVRLVSPSALTTWVEMDESIMLGAIISQNLGSLIDRVDCDTDHNGSMLIDLMSMADLVVDSTPSNLARLAANDNRRTFWVRPEDNAPGWRVVTSSRQCPPGAIPIPALRDVGAHLIAA